MFSTGSPTTPSYKEIISKVSESDILNQYLNITKIPCIINSPLRKDNKPSFGLYSRDGEKIYWTDFATNEHGNTFDLLERLWNCSFDEVLERIYKECITNKNVPVQTVTNSKIVSRCSNIDLQCKIREWRPYDIEYWASYGVPLSFLKYAEVYPISNKIIIKDGKKFVLGADKYAYVFVERKEGKVTLKIYQPFNKNGYKWANKHDRSVISLWTKIPESGDKLVICSSLKDALCLWSNTGIPAIAVQGEGYGISNTALNVLKERYKKIYILFDNDEAGLKDGISLSNKTGFINVVLPPFNGGKDVSDFYKTHGKKEFVDLIFSLIQNQESETYPP